MHGTLDEHTLYQLCPSSALPSWRELLVTIVRKMAADVVSGADWLAGLQDRERQRRALAALDDRMIKDIGIDRAEIWRELSKPMWRD